MRKLLFLLLAIVIGVGLAACGESSSTEEKEVTDVGSTDESAEAADVEEADAGADENEADEEDENEVEEFDKEIVDNDDFKAVLTSVEKIADKEWDEERIEVTFEVENKRDETVEVQAGEVSADDKMVDESMLMMSQEVAGGKKADAKLVIESFDGEELPEMKENLEMKLRVFDWEYMDFEEDYDVKIEFE